MHRRSLAAVLTVAAALGPSLAEAQARRSRERDLHEWEVKAEKMRLHLQPAMRAHGVRMWVLMSRENNPDPALELFGGYGITGWYGHRNAYVFYDPSSTSPPASSSSAGEPSRWTRWRTR